MRRIEQGKRPEFASALKAARTRAGWTQKDLADQLEVGQQTVSKWERGSAVPDLDAAKRLFALFPDDSAIQLGDAFEKEHGQTRRQAPAMSTTALATRLNLDHLRAEQFEAFSADLFHSMYPEAKVHVYGVSGDVQHGVDIEIRFPEGYRYVAQCKRVKYFGPQKVVAAVRNQLKPAKRKFLLITRVATRQTREKARNYERQGWELWDIDDVSRHVRHLSNDRARLLVDAYAPGQRKQFLGIDEPSPFSAPKSFFREFLRPQAIFSHTWAIVGRTNELRELHEAVEAGAACITIVGPGGSGKSRLALEVLTRLGDAWPERTLRVLAQGASVTAADVERYRDARGIFLVEDAHDRDDLEGTLSLFRQLAPDATLLLTTRPYRLEYLRSVFTRQGLDDRTRVVHLGRLSSDDLVVLAREILTARQFRPDLAEDIARAADHSPLFVVIASNLVADKRLHPRVLGNEETFKSRVLAHFRDVLTQSLVRDAAEQAKAREILNLVAVLQPVDLGGTAFATSLQTIYKRHAGDYDRMKQLLADASVLVARGGWTRIVPDMLGDYILEQACTGAAGRAGTFPERVLASLQPGQLRNVLHNLAKLDWRLSVKDGPTVRASSQFWRAMESLYIEREVARDGILEAVESAAYFLPVQALEFLDSIDAASSGAPVDRVSRIVRNAAYHREYVRDVAERLWELGKDMAGPLNSWPDHPIRLLQTLVSIEPGKPLECIADVVECGLELLNEPDAALHAWSPFEFLEQALATEGRTNTAKGNVVQIGHFTVNVNRFAPLRKRVIDAAFRLVEHADPRLSLRAVRTIGQALHYPMGAVGAVPPNKALLDTEFVETLGRFEQLVRRGYLDPLVVTAILRAVGWHAGYATDPTRSAAQAIFDAVPHTLDQDLTECLLEGWGLHRERDNDNQPAQTLEAWHEHQRQVARALRTHADSPEKAIDVLRNRLRFFSAAGDAFKGEPQVFIRLLSEEWPELSRAITQRAAEDPGDPLAQFTEQTLGTLLASGADDRIALAKALLASGSIDLKRRVACAYGYSLAGAGPIKSDDLAMLETLLSDADEVTVQYAIKALNKVATDNPLLGKTLFFKANAGISERTARELASLFCNCEPLRRSFTAVDVLNVLSNLITLSEIKEYWIQKMVATLSGSHAEDVLDWLLRRIIRAESDPRGYSYRAIPFHWDQQNGLRFRETGYLRTAMGRVLDVAREAEERHSKHTSEINELFAAIVGQFDPEVRTFLSEYLTTADAHGVVAVSQVLSKASAGFVFGNVEFVEHLLHRAGRFGGRPKQVAEFALHQATTSGMKSGTPGKPFPEDVALKKSADEALATIRPGSPARRVFTWIRDHAQEEINRSHLEAELLEEED